MEQLGFGEVFLFNLALTIFCFKFLALHVAIAVIIGALTLRVLRLKYRYGYWKRIGVPGPTPNWFIGNDGELQRGLHVIDEEWTKAYGDTYGEYVFGYADLVTSNLEILRQVMVKQFGSFTDRGLPFGMGTRSEHDDNLQAHTIVNLDGEHWKSVRAQISPVFTSGKIKQLLPVFDECTRKTCSLLAEVANTSKEINLKEYTEKLSMDMTSQISFGQDFNVQTDNESEFLKMTKEALDFNMKDPVIMLYFLFPNIMSTIQKTFHVTLLFHRSNKYLHRQLNQILEKRIREEAAHDETARDFFGLLLKSLKEEDGVKRDAAAEDAEVLQTEVFSRQKTKKVLTRMEMLSQAFVFLIAGYHNVANAIALVLYHLAQFPDIQEKVHKEIVEVVGTDASISAEQAAKMEYIQQVLDETLRLYPPTPRVNRKVTEACEIGGIKLRVGDTVTVPVYIIQRDPRHFPDPLKHTKEAKAKRNPMAHMPFGYGPRVCIATRLVYYQVRVAVAHIVREFKLELGPNSPSLPLRFTSFGPVKFTDEPLVVLKRRL